MTCRKRRVKCDEIKTRCGPCTKSDRECTYAAFSTSPLAAEATAARSGSDASAQHPTTGSFTGESIAAITSPATKKSIAGDIDPQLFTNSPELRFDLSPLTITASLPSPNSAPFEWYDLLAEDAVNNIQKHNLGFDSGILSRRQSPVPETPNIDPELQSPSQPPAPSLEPWNSPEVIHLSEEELVLFQHFVDYIGPILDLFDSTRQFSTHVPRLAVRNVGLLRSLLAVAARHLALQTDLQPQPDAGNGQAMNATAAGETSNMYLQTAMHYYYETLRYLSQNLLYPAYTKSGEIIATAILISTYEMFDSQGSYSDGGWERHLRGIFWIQRSQDNNGETADGLRRAAWWAWLRQDIWVAFRQSRRTLTIWRPTKRLMDLTPEELARRIIYIACRCVDFAANEKHYDMNIRIEQGDKLLQALDDWFRILPAAFRPIYAVPPNESDTFSPIWIHPPSYAAAIQTFHFARIIVLINQPSMGGMNAFRQRQRNLEESTDVICGIAMMHQIKDLPSNFVDVYTLYAGKLSLTVCSSHGCRGTY